MPLVTTKEMYQKAIKGGYSIGAFNVDSIDIMKAVLLAAEETKSPVIIALSPGALKFIGINHIRKVMDCVKEEFSIPFALQIDQCKDVEFCKKCVDLGFTSVMIDSSAYDYNENIRQTKEVVEYAHSKGVEVESQLGVMKGYHNDFQDSENDFTSSQDAVDFIQKTGVDSLAIAIGTAHGAYKYSTTQKPKLVFNIVEEIQQKLPDFPLVLHGASSLPSNIIRTFNQNGGKLKDAKGLPEELVTEAGARGICKVNISTDVRIAFIGGFRKALSENPEQFDARLFINAGCQAVTQLVIDKIKNVLHSAYHAFD